MHQNLFGSFSMGGIISREYEEVVHIYNEPSFSKDISKRVIHELLKGCWGVGLAKEHDHWFKESFVGDECSLPLISLPDSNIVVFPSYIELGEDASILEFVN